VHRAGFFRITCLETPRHRPRGPEVKRSPFAALLAHHDEARMHLHAQPIVAASPDK
jgi:hypothetical protein